MLFFLLFWNSLLFSIVGRNKNLRKALSWLLMLIFALLSLWMSFFLYSSLLFFSLRFFKKYFSLFAGPKYLRILLFILLSPLKFYDYVFFSYLSKYTIYLFSFFFPYHLPSIFASRLNAVSSVSSIPFDFFFVLFPSWYG